MKRLKRLLIFLGIVCVLLLSCRLANPVAIALENNKPSESIGSGSNGKMKNGKRIPNKGKNYRAASYFLTAIGRNAVNHRVRDLMLEAYDSLYALQPQWKYLYGETGWPHGGKFWPHYTHQNGLVVDFMVPVKKKGKTSRLKTHVFNRWGYATNFDTTGHHRKYDIDFESLAAHLYYLKKLGPKHQLRIKWIIFAPEFVPYLRKTNYGQYLRDIQFLYKPHWVRHDDHYHTEFELVNK